MYTHVHLCIYIFIYILIYEYILFVYIWTHECITLYFDWFLVSWSKYGCGNEKYAVGFQGGLYFQLSMTIYFKKQKQKMYLFGPQETVSQTFNL